MSVKTRKRKQEKKKNLSHICFCFFMEKFPNKSRKEQRKEKALRLFAFHYFKAFLCHKNFQVKLRFRRVFFPHFKQLTLAALFYFWRKENFAMKYFPVF